ncbi:hypothetical protein F0L74_29440 [Chitinophaga agrisoli]|uniref:Uncharacterized protein n=1 Tax=Chitinophaga agrisoli TaxID=2607653 RepID=A0A5B2VMK0_9BACT|nr:hypothetical protein [Chitinophaga agrisoli]KAA2240291.1 hypothetical protein F0L74_29440 [Chitinophaga agrisoli]
MIPLFNYPDLQRRFCEGFTFYPFKALEQYSGFIYKNYTREDHMPNVLDHYSREYEFNDVQAQKLLRKLQQKDIPVTGELLFKLQLSSRQLEERFRSLKRSSAIHRQLLETMDTYHRLLAVYQHNVQERIAVQLSVVPDENEDDPCNIVSVLHIQQVQDVVREFLQSTEVMAIYLKECVAGKRRFAKLILTVEETDNLQELVSLTAQVRSLQDRNFCMLEEWKQQVVLFERRHTMN